MAPSRGQTRQPWSNSEASVTSTRHIAGIMARAGLPLATPFLDDRVGRRRAWPCVCMERSTPWRFSKPLIVEGDA